MTESTKSALTGMCLEEEDFIMIHLKNSRFLSGSVTDPEYQHK